MQNVIIGIVAKHRDTDRDAKRKDLRIRDEVKQAIFDNGAIAIGILTADEEYICSNDDWQKYKVKTEEIIKQIELCDGIVLQGGDACEPFENWIAKYCYKKDIPVLGICAGQNSIVRGLDGTTFKIKNPEKHNKSFDDYVHNIKINKDSYFYKIVQKEEMMVNSRHKRAIKDCPMLKKVAFCDDGYADVVESKEKKFYLGVRFHPESLYKTDENMNNIFKYFINVCKNNEKR